MGIPGAGKTRLSQTYVERGYLRLNRDERGGTLRAITGALDEQLSAGVREVVLDNTFLSRAARSYVIEATTRHAVPVRCIWLSTPLAQAQVNLVMRLLDLAGTLPGPDELRALARVAEGVMAPTSQMRALRELEPPSTDEGFAGVEVVPFSRAEPSEPGGIGVFVAAGALREPGWTRSDRARRSRSATPRVRLESGRTAGPARLLAWRGSRSRSPARSRAPSVHMAPARRDAGAGRRFRASRWPSPGSTGWRRHARSSSAPVRRIARSRPRSPSGARYIPVLA